MATGARPAGRLLCWPCLQANGFNCGRPPRVLCGANVSVKRRRRRFPVGRRDHGTTRKPNSSISMKLLRKGWSNSSSGNTCVCMIHRRRNCSSMRLPTLRTTNGLASRRAQARKPRCWEFRFLTLTKTSSFTEWETTRSFAVRRCHLVTGARSLDIGIRAPPGYVHGAGNA